MAPASRRVLLLATAAAATPACQQRDTQNVSGQPALKNVGQLPSSGIPDEDGGEIWNGMDRWLGPTDGNLLLETFGGSRWELTVTAPAQAPLQLFIQGPFPLGSPKPAPAQAKTREIGLEGQRSSQLAVLLNLEGPAVYRIIVARQDRARLQATCRLRCARSSRSLNDLVAGRTEGRAALAERLSGTVASLASPSPEVNYDAEEFSRRLLKSTGRGDSLDRWLTFNPTLLGKALAAAKFEDLEQSPRPFATQHDSRARRQAIFDAARAQFNDHDIWQPKSVSITSLSKDLGLGLTSGTSIRASLTERAIDQASALALFLEALARRPNSRDLGIKVANKRIESPTELVRALADSGHLITVSREHAYADFFRLSMHDIPLRIATWVSTPLREVRGTAIVVPYSDPRLTWRIEGPRINAKIAFRYGIDGLGFFPDLATDVDWHMRCQTWRTRSDEDIELVGKALEAAAALLRRNDREAVFNTQRMARDGLGTLGGGSDAIAFVEQSLFGRPSQFPLLRAGIKYKIDETDKIIAALPNDLGWSSSQSLDTPLGQAVARRILDATPRSPAWPAAWGSLAELFDRRLAADIGHLVTVVHPSSGRRSGEQSVEDPGDSKRR